MTTDPGTITTGKPPVVVTDNPPIQSNTKTIVAIVVLTLLVLIVAAAAFTYYYAPAHQWIVQTGWPAITNFFHSTVGINVALLIGVGVGLGCLATVFYGIRIHRANQIQPLDQQGSE